MKLSVLMNLYHDKTLDEVLARMSELGIKTVEVGAGGYPGKDQCDPEELLADGNPLHPQKELAEMYDKDFKNAVLLAEKLSVDTVITFSGCPGDCENSLYPNWVTCSWPEDYMKILDWQWNEKVIPYWQKTGAFAKEHGVDHIAFEMHPGFCVYNPATLLRLRAAVGDVIGANFDPSHLIWQGMDVVAAIRELKGAIYHVHAKDTKIDKYNTARNGVLDVKHYGDELERSWIFRTVGYGNGEDYWREIVSNLRLCGYDRVLSIEHEDSLMSLDEGLEKAVSFLQNIIIKEEKPTTMAWA